MSICIDSMSTFFQANKTLSRAHILALIFKLASFAKHMNSI